jgi:hypothetical protein
MTPIPLPAHIVGHGGHELTLAVAAILVSAIGALSLATSYLERQGRLDGTNATVPFDRWSAIIAAGWSFGAAAIHFAVIGDHFATVPAEGVFFIVVAWFQVGWAAWFAARPLPSLAILAAVVNLAVVAIWTWSRAVGLPIGGHGDGTEAIAVNDAIATAFEIALVLTLGVGYLIRRRPLADRLRLPPSSAVGWAGSALVVAVVLASVGIVEGSSHDHAVDGTAGGHVLLGEPGTVTFGSQLNPDGTIVDPATTLSSAESVVWLAVFPEPVGAQTVQLVILTIDGTGAEVERAREDVFVARADTQSLTEVRELGSVGDGPGTYRIRYLSGEAVLAQGDVTLTP